MIRLNVTSGVAHDMSEVWGEATVADGPIMRASVPLPERIDDFRVLLPVYRQMAIVSAVRRAINQLQEFE